MTCILIVILGLISSLLLLITIRKGSVTSQMNKSLVICGIFVVVAATVIGCSSTADMNIEPDLKSVDSTVNENGIQWGSVILGDEMFDYYAEYLEALGRSWEEASKYEWNLSDHEYELAAKSFSPVVYASMLESQRINDNLMAYLMEIERDDSIGVQHAVHFVACIDDELWVICNEVNIPDELREGLEELSLIAEMEYESLGPSMGDYWDEVNEVFGPFLEDLTIIQLDHGGYYEFADVPFDTTFEDFVYSTDSWEFTYFKEPICVDGTGAEAIFSLTNSAGQNLEIYSNSGLFIGDDGEYTIQATRGNTTPDEMIAMLRKWAKGELEDVAPLMAGQTDYANDVMEVFGAFFSPASIEVRADDHETAAQITDMTLEEFVFSVEDWEFQYSAGPEYANIAGPFSESSIVITGADGTKLFIVEELECIYVLNAVPNENGEGSIITGTYGTSIRDMVSSILEWAKTY